MVILVPIWFYEFGSAIYLIASIIGLLLVYFSFKIYNFTSKRQHLLLHAGFIFITAGFIAMFVGNIHSYLIFKACSPECIIDSTQPAYFWTSFGNYGYYTTSLIGYTLLALSYLNSRKKKLRLGVLPAIGVGTLIQTPNLYVLFPFFNQYFQIFHILSMLLVSYIAMKSWSNYSKTRDNNSLLVFSGFTSIDIYHFLMYMIPVSATFFALAHLALLIGFGSLLVMLVRVNRK